MKFFKLAIVITAILLASCANPSGSYLLDAPDQHLAKVESFSYVNHVEIINLGDNRYHISSEGEKFSGIYRWEKPLLILEKADLPRVSGYKWRMIDKQSLVLIGEPPMHISERRYMPATLTRYNK